MKTLYLIRHAKSDQHGGLADFDRPLNQRGQAAAVKIGLWLKQKHIQPEWVICSAAKRTQQTLEGICQHISIPATLIDYNERAYLANLYTLLELLGQCPEDMDHILMLGHNPGMEELLIYLCGSNLPLSNKGKLMATATLAQICLPDDWHQLPSRCGKLIQIIRPSEIKQSA